MIYNSSANYWISQNALSVILNALGDPNRVQCSVASGAAILCYVKDIIDYDAGHNYRRWPLTISPTYFNSNTEKYVYVAIPRTTAVGTEAVVVFPSQKIDLYGRVEVEGSDEEYQQIGSEDYYYIWLQAVISSSGDGTTPRRWTSVIDCGSLSTDEAISSTETYWYRWDPITQAVTFLKEIVMDAGAIFANLKARLLTLGGHDLRGVAVRGETPEDSDDTIVTPAYLEGMTADRFLRKDQDDRTPYSLGVGGDLSVEGLFDAIQANIDKLFSHNYSGSGLGDTGWMLTNDDGSGHSLLEIDNLLVRMKATFMELEIRKETFTGGNNHYSPAGSVVYKVDFLTEAGDELGYRTQKVPWLLKGIAFLFPQSSLVRNYTRQRRIRYAFTIDDLTPEERAQVAKFRLYLISDDGTSATRNWWQAGDQARCQSFNKALSRENKRDNVYDTTTAGVTDPTSPISSDFYWRLITEVGSKVLDDGKTYDFVDMPYEHYGPYEDEYQRNPDNFCAAGSGIPHAGDTIVCMGNRFETSRMNLLSIISVATDYSDAPAIRAYRGIHTFSFDGCLVWVISPEEMSVRSKSFRFIDDSGYTFPVPLERGAYETGLRYHWYDRVSHNGSIWLCQVADTKVWVNQAGVNIGTPATADIIEGEGNFTYIAGAAQIPSLESDEVITGTDHYYKRGTVNGQMVYYVQAWTYDEPVDTNANWHKQVGKGTEITQSIIRYAASLDGVNPPADTASNWKTDIASTNIKPGQYLWTRTTTFYSDNRTPTVEYSVARWGIDGDGISEIDAYYWATLEVITMTPEYDAAHLLPWNPSASTADKKMMWAPTFADLQALYGGVGQMQGMYVWEKTVVKYDMAPNPDGTPVTKPDAVTYRCNRIGNDGQIGQEEYYLLAASDDFATAFPNSTGKSYPDYDKIGIRWYNQAQPAAENYRLAVATPQSPNINLQMWSAVMPTYDNSTPEKAAKIYLWNFEQRVDGMGTEYATRPICLGNHAKGITGILELYALSSSKTPISAARPIPTDIDAKNTFGVIPTTGFEDPQVWGDERYDRAPTEALPYQWNWTRTLYSDNTYEDHYHVSAVRGSNGEDGSGEETIYIRNNTGITPSTPPNSGKGTAGSVSKDNWTADEVAHTDDWVPDGWTDTPVGIEATNQYEYESKRRLGSADAQGHKTWGAFSAPKLRSKWGKNGIDGDGVEYVFIHTVDDTAPTMVNHPASYRDSKGRAYTDDDFLPKAQVGQSQIECNDNPMDPTEEYPYVWIAKRTKGLPAADGSREWKTYYECLAADNYKMSLFSNFAENAVRLSLDNEHEDFLFDGTTLVAPSNGASSGIHLYDGHSEVTNELTISGANPTLTIDSATGVPASGTGAPTITGTAQTGYKLNIPTINAATAKVVVKAVYGGIAHYAEFTGNKTNQDKYDLTILPSSIAYNSATYQTQTISIGATGIGIGGTRLSPTISLNQNVGNLRVFIAYVFASGAMTDKMRQLSTSLSVPKSICQSYVGIYFELRWYFDPSSSDSAAATAYRVCDYETVEIAKAENGTSPWIADLDNEMDSIACDADDHPVSQQQVTTNLSLFYGSTKKDFKTAVTGAETGITVQFNNGSTAHDSDTVTVTFGTSATVSGKKVFTITLTAKDDDSIIRTLKLTVNGIKGDARYNLTPSDSSVVKSKSGSYTPNTLSCGYTKYDVKKGAFVTASGGTIKYIKDSETESSAHAYAVLTPGTDFIRKVTYLLYVGGVIVDRETIPIVSDGNDGKDSVQAYASPDKISVPCLSNGSVASPVSKTIIFSLKVGGVPADEITNITWGTPLPDGVSINPVQSNPIAKEIVISTNATATGIEGGIVFTVYGTDADGNSVSAIVTVALIGALQGNDGIGQRGKTGRFYYYDEEYDNTKTYTMALTQAPYVKLGNNFYMLDNQGVEPEGGTMTVTGVSPDTVGQTKWTLMASEQKYYIAKAVFGDMAQFGAFCVNGDWHISTYGRILNTEYNTSNWDSPAMFVGTNVNDKAPAYVTFDPLLMPKGFKKFNSSELNFNNTSYQTKLTIAPSNGMRIIRVTGNANGKFLYVRIRHGNYQRELSISGSGYKSMFFVFSVSGTVDIEARVNSSVTSGTITAIEQFSFVPEYAVDGKTGHDYSHDVSLTGSLKAKNVLRNVLMFWNNDNYTSNIRYSRDAYYILAENDWVTSSGYERGMYIEAEEVTDPNFDTANLINNTYDADVVVCMFGQQLSSGVYYGPILPRPDDFLGKVVEIYSSMYSGFGNMMLQVVDGSACFCRRLYSDGSCETYGPFTFMNVQIGVPVKAIAVKVNNKCRWLIMEQFISAYGGVSGSFNPNNKTNITFESGLFKSAT